MQCPKCKAEVLGKFCRQCGTAMPLPPKDASRVTLCPACGASVGAGAKFCTRCAAPLAGSAGRVAVQVVKCLHCGTELKPGAKFCKSCGKSTTASEVGFHDAPTVVETPATPAAPAERASTPISSLPAPATVSSPASSAAPLGTVPVPAATPVPAVTPEAEIETRPIPAATTLQAEIETRPKIAAASPVPLPPTVSQPLPEVELPGAARPVERAPVSSVAPSVPSPAPLRMPPTPAPPPIPAKPPQAEIRTRPKVVATAPPAAARPIPAPLPKMEQQRTSPRMFSASGSGSSASNKTILFTGVAVLGLAFGGLTYWYVLRKPAVSSVPSQPAVTQPATPAGDKPSPAQSATPAADQPAASQPATAAADNSAAQPQSSAQTQEVATTETKKAASQHAGTASTTSSAPSASSLPAAPAKSADAPPNAPTDLTGNWQGEYTNTGQATKVSLQISKDSSDLLTGTLIFDAGGSNSATCAITGVYNPRSKFLVLKVANCQGQPPDYLPGKIGFSSVEVTATQMVGVNSAHNSFLNISRK